MALYQYRSTGMGNLRLGEVGNCGSYVPDLEQCMTRAVLYVSTIETRRCQTVLRVISEVETAVTGEEGKAKASLSAILVLTQQTAMHAPIPIVVAALVLISVSAHPGHDVTAELARRREFLASQANSLDHCASVYRASGMEARNVARRAQLHSELLKRSGLHRTTPAASLRHLLFF